MLPVSATGVIEVLAVERVLLYWISLLKRYWQTYGGNLMRIPVYCLLPALLGLGGSMGCFDWPIFDNSTSPPKISLPGYLTLVCSFCTVSKKRKGRVTSKEKQRKTLLLPVRRGSNNETPVQKRWFLQVSRFSLMRVPPARRFLWCC